MVPAGLQWSCGTTATSPGCSYNQQFKVAMNASLSGRKAQRVSKVFEYSCPRFDASSSGSLTISHNGQGRSSVCKGAPHDGHASISDVSVDLPEGLSPPLHGS